MLSSSSRAPKYCTIGEALHLQSVPMYCWSGELEVMYCLVWLAVSPWYYFLYKRAALRVSDPRFYEDVDWINRQMQTR